MTATVVMTSAALFQKKNVRDERAVPESSHQWCTKKKEDQRREAIRFEIPVTRSAFDQGEGASQNTNTGRSVLRNTVQDCTLLGVPARGTVGMPRSRTSSLLGPSLLHSPWKTLVRGICSQCHTRHFQQTHLQSSRHRFLRPTSC